MLCSIIFVNGLLVGWILFVSAVSDDRKADWCVRLEKNIVKEYECCLQERKRDLPVPLTDYFPSLPSRSAANDLNLTVDKLIHLFCSKETHDVSCINQILDRVYRIRKCVSNETVQIVETSVIVQERRRRFLCDKNGAYGLYNSGANDCLRDSPVSLCMKYVKENFDLEGNKHEPNCDKFHRLLSCLQDEWSEKCGETGSSSLLALMRAMYVHFHCPDYVEVEPTTISGADSWRCRETAVVLIFLFVKNVHFLLKFFM